MIVNFRHIGRGSFPVANELQSLFHQARTFRAIHKMEVHGVVAEPQNLPLSGGRER
jgi:hypothetical protein